MKVNESYSNLEQSYLFSTIAKKVNEYAELNPDKKIIRLGVGDVSLPLCKAVIDALHSAVDEMGVKESFRGYGPEQGYDFLRESIQNYYLSRNVKLDIKEIFISDGAKSDLGNILELFDNSTVALMPDPIYPAYVDANIMSGRQILLMDANKENNFLPLPNKNVKADLIYICSPNNPTGAVYNKEQLKQWVDYANSINALIIFDAAYEIFISDENLPKSIYEIDGARNCAIEICSLSKTAGFTGTRCGYTIIPNDIINGRLNRMWVRRQTTKFNGVPYIIQRAAQAVFTPEGLNEIQYNIGYYRENARIMDETLDKLGIWYTGGKHSPYIWLECPNKQTSWEFFDYLLNELQVVGTPGSGFGKNGEGYLRLTSFGSRENTVEAMERFNKISSLVNI